MTFALLQDRCIRLSLMCISRVYTIHSFSESRQPRAVCGSMTLPLCLLLDVFFLPNCGHFDSFASDPSHCSQAPGHLAAFSSAFSAKRTLSLHCKLCPLDCGSSLHSVMDKPNDDSATSVTGADLSAALPRRMLFSQFVVAY